MLRFLARVVAASLLFVLAGALGFGAASWVAPERLRQYTERRLSDLLHTPVRLHRVGIGLALGVELIGEEARLWADPYGAQLYVHRVSVRLATRPLLEGRFEISQLRLDGARLRIRRDADGRLSPPPFAGPDPLPEQPPPPEAEAWLRPVGALAVAARWLLEQRELARVIELRDSVLLFSDESLASRAPAPGATGNGVYSLERVQARLEHTGRAGGERLRVAGRLFRGDRPFGRVEWVASRTPSEPLSMELAATGLELRELEPVLVPRGSKAKLSGQLTGVLGFQARAPDSDRLELDVLLSNFEGDLGRSAGLTPLRSDRVAARFELAVAPERVDVEHARISSGELDLQLAGEIGRPIGARSAAELSVSFREVALARALQQAGFFPLPGRPDAGSRIESGTLRQLTARGRSHLAHWRDFLSGDDERPPEGFSVQAELVDGRLLLDSGQRLSEVSGQVSFEGDRAEIHGGRAKLDDKPLPVLDIRLDGVSHLTATRSDRRRLSVKADPLLGMRTLWAVMRPEPHAGEEREPPRIQLRLDHLEHPAVLWPLLDVKAEIHPLEHGVRADVERALWAGAPAQGVVEWIFEPEEQVRVAVALEPPVAELPAREDPESWAVGRFFVGDIDARSWKQQQATGRFEATGGEILLEDVSVLLVPRGALSGSAKLELASRETLPLELDLALSNADVGGLAEQVGVEPGLISGTLAARGRLAGSLVPGQPFFSGLSGELELRASDGRIRRGLPPIVAIALASESLNPFKKRKSLRYSKIQTRLAIDQGRSRTQEFAIDGPDVRMFASGSLDIGHPPHALDADVAVFLFRQVDAVLGRIPLLNALLLGQDDSIMAAYYQVDGPWDAPKATLFPLRTITSGGPVGILFDGVPHFVQRSFEALGSMLGKPVAPEDVRLAPSAPAGEGAPGAPASLPPGPAAERS